MKELNFRVWLRDCNLMENVIAINFHTEKMMVSDNNDCHLYSHQGWINLNVGDLMQYINKRDKNNIKIYEKDIINILDKLFVVCDPIDPIIITGINVIFPDSLLKIDSADINVVGNIYEVENKDELIKNLQMEIIKDRNEPLQAIVKTSEDWDMFFSNCNIKTTYYCPKCNAVVQKNQNYCKNCGQKITVGSEL